MEGCSLSRSGAATVVAPGGVAVIALAAAMTIPVATTISTTLAISTALAATTVTATLDHAAACAHAEMAIGESFVVPSVVIPARDGHFDDFFDFAEKLTLVFSTE
jgi:hypothetical protein